MQDNYIKVSIALPDFYIKCSEEYNNTIFIRVSPIKQSLKCPKCDSIADRLHDKKEFLVRDIPIHDKAVILVVEKIRLRCACCGHRGIPITIPFLNKYQRKTDRFIEFIAKEVSKTSINEVCKQLELGYQEVKTAFEIYSNKLINEIDDDIKENGIEYFGIDEFALKKGHNYAVALINPLSATNKIIDILDDRTKENLIKYFSQWSINARKKVKFVTMDMWNGYNSSISKMFPNAKIIIDKFHVIKKIGDAFKDVRKSVSKQLDKESKTKLFKDRYLFKKGNENVTDEEYLILIEHFEKSSYLEIAYELKEEFRDIFVLHSKNEAMEAFERWCKRVKDNKIKEFKKVINTVNNWYEQIFNYFDKKLTNGPIEGINNKIKLIKRAGYGFCSCANLKRRIIARFAK